MTDRIATLMQQNRRTTDGHSYTIPSPSSYPYQWFWDSCFHALILRHLDVAAAKAELAALVALQYEDGFIGHVSYWERQAVLDVDWHKERTSDLIQPPLLAYAVSQVYAVSEDHDWLQRIYPAVARYYEFLLRERDLRGLGLIGYVNPDESGEDNSPRFDTLFTLPPQHAVETHLEKRYHLFSVHKDCALNAWCTSRTFWVEDTPLNAFLIWNLEHLAELARACDDAAAAKRYRAAARRTAAAMREHMFADGVFAPLLGLTGERTVEGTWARFAPLVSQQYTKREAATLIERDLLDEAKFWLPAGVPTVGKHDPAYDPVEPGWGEAWQHPHWRGPIWMNIHWFLYHGLCNYGYDALARELRDKSSSLLEQSGFREYYHPETGKGMGAQDFTWGALVIDMQ